MNYELKKGYSIKTFFHIGFGPKSKDPTTRAYNTDEWAALRLDIDPAVQTDIIGAMTDISSLAPASVHAIFSSHNIEHPYPHEAPIALAEFKRVLKPDGFLIVTAPDQQAVFALIAEDKLTEPAYHSPAGPIAPLDILYGHRPSMARGNLFMIHRCGFTQKVLSGAIQQAGFVQVAIRRREHPFSDLWAFPTILFMEETELRPLTASPFPG